MKFKLVAACLLLTFAVGCSSSEKESTSTKVGNKVGESITDFASGVGKGVDNKSMVNVELSKDIIEKGISITTSKTNGLDSIDKKGIAVYMISQKAMKSELIAKAYNKEGQEIGRGITAVDFSNDDAKYVTFKFDKEMDSQLAVKYTVDFKR